MQCVCVCVGGGDTDHPCRVAGVIRVRAAWRERVEELVLEGQAGFFHVREEGKALQQRLCPGGKGNRAVYHGC